ncbi:MAG: C39 family peptidase [Anaerosomatales bacterium]|nr:C39 family peptidase [Anaerosomatales bacterium]MDT8434732.1 C39 family peptidase [Anaerosomatales bacterium]
MKRRHATTRAVTALLIVLGVLVPAYAFAAYRMVPTTCTSRCAKQQTTYWCGPASTHFVLHSQGRNLAQSTLARELKGYRGATAIENIPAVLNRYKRVSIKYVHVPRRYITSTSLVRSIITYAVDRKSSAIPCVNPYPYTNTAGYYSPGLPTYSGTKAGGHYVVIRGYNISSTSDYVYYFDPHYSSTHYGKRRASVWAMARSIRVKNYGSQGIVY